jgi:hypothetical protein
MTIHDPRLLDMLARLAEMRGTTPHGALSEAVATMMFAVGASDAMTRDVLAEIRSRLPRLEPLH